ncbi:MAG: DNA mismatch repair endonuclease MutL [Verrucomicrobia bacterium]|nr:DNA mismatch repair endonuclease MutL [Verrucomicrobiota bacterium]
MAKKIALLTPEVINQIAAGEVLENPGSAVKELMENSLDAGSRWISVEIKGGGHQWIRVEDDGCGMGRDDAVDCLQKHATSKIKETDDLFKLATMGFRGEALAAIASVSQLEIQTYDGQESTCLKAEGGKVVSIEPCARNPGTTIDIRSLFYNVPARLKFQKSASSSATQILKIVQTVALAHPHIAFTLRSQEKIVFQTESTPDWRRRAKEILGPLAQEISYKLDGYEIHGLIGTPDEAKGNRSGQYLFLNQRPIFSPLVARAVKDGYSTRLKETQYPIFLLFVTLPPEEFDINVHPQKRDVRFRDDAKVYRLVERAIAQSFQSESLPQFSAPIHFEAPKEEDPPPLPWTFRETAPAYVPEPLALPPLKRRALAIVGSFALFEGEECSWLDLKGAEARILFENTKKSTQSAQTLLWPVEIKLSAEEALQGEEWVQELKNLGIESRFLGGRMLAIDALPVGLETNDVQNFFDRYKTDRKAASAICRFCRSRKKFYSLEEASLIERRLAECDDREYDPLGRKIYRILIEDELAKWIELS